MARKTVAPSEAIGPAPEDTAPVAGSEPEAPEPAAKEPEPEGITVQVNSIQKVLLPDGTEWIATLGVHHITNEALAKKLTELSRQKRQIFILNPAA